MGIWVKLLMGDPQWNKQIDPSTGIHDMIGGDGPDDLSHNLEVDASEEGLEAGRAWSAGALTLEDLQDKDGIDDNIIDKETPEDKSK